jgi:type IV pilus assembly protein PilN
MLRTNLSTRPFYNERIVRVVLTLAAIAAVTATAFNLAEAIELSRRRGELVERIGRDDQRARQLQREAATVRSSIAPEELEAVVQAAREANGLIDRRTFSWTALLNHVEETLPADVMLLSISPTIAADGVTLAMVVRGRSVGEIDHFMDRLEETGAFSGVLSRDEAVDEDGTFRATLVGVYRALGAEAAGTSSAGAGTAPGEGPTVERAS